MHRSLVTILVYLLSCVVGFCQQRTAVEIKADRLNDKEYQLSIQIKLQKGWHVYAQTDESSGIEGIQLNFNNSTIRMGSGPVMQSGETTMIHDKIFDGKFLKVYTTDFTLTQLITIERPIPESLTVTVRGFAASQTEFIPFEETKLVTLEGGGAVAGTAKISSVDIDHPLADCGNGQSKNKSLWAIYLIGFGGGLIALLTPCIFPMIPVTVSYFTNKNADKKKGIANSFLYGSFIFLIYLLASIPFHFIGNINPQIFNIISTNAYVNVFFFAVFILFALSFFGLFEIKLPSTLSNAAGNKSGIFFMALTLVVVSFSCTGIILGSLLVNALSSGGSAWQLTTGMGGFGTALALPFGLFATFPQWLQKLPKSGGWLDTVKKSLAFIELALAIKFLSNADLVEHWGILKREVFIGLWIIIAVTLALYLFGVFNKKQPVRDRLQNADKVPLRRPELSPIRIAFAVAVTAFAIYLVPGITKTSYANLKLLSGFPPPLSYSIYGKSNIHGKGVEPDVINDYDKALQLAKQQKKALLIDFTGWACVNCRKMEEQVWTKSSIQQLIKENYILVSLYVDDRKKLPGGITISQKWARFQSENFKQVTQPLYVLLSPDEKLLNHPVGYTPEETTYKNWLQFGIRAFEESKKKLYGKAD